MCPIVSCLKAEFQKHKHSALLFMHVCIPVLGAAVFVSYYQISGWQAVEKVSAYLEVLAVAFPFLIGIIIGMAVQTEMQAGHFQLMLGTIPSRMAVIIGKMGFLFICAFAAVVLALGVFCGFYREAPLMLYVKAAILLLAAMMPLYLLHLFIGMNYGKGASMGLGIAGSLVAALMLTGLGDAIWYYVPWAWGVRAMDFLVLSWDRPELYAQISFDFAKGMCVCVICTCILFVIHLVWFKNWEGGKEWR